MIQRRRFVVKDDTKYPTLPFPQTKISKQGKQTSTTASRYSEVSANRIMGNVTRNRDSHLQQENDTIHRTEMCPANGTALNPVY